MTPLASALAVLSVVAPRTGAEPMDSAAAPALAAAAAKVVCAQRFPLCSLFTVDDSCAQAEPRQLTPDRSSVTADADADYRGVTGAYRALGDGGPKVSKCLEAHGLFSVAERYEAGLKTNPSGVIVSCVASTPGADGVTQGNRISLPLGVLNTTSHLSEETILFHESFHTAQFPHGHDVDYTYLATSCCEETWSLDNGPACDLLTKASGHIQNHGWWLTADYLKPFAAYLKVSGREGVLMELLHAVDPQVQKNPSPVCDALRAYYGDLAALPADGDARKLAVGNGCLH